MNDPSHSSAKDRDCRQNCGRDIRGAPGTAPSQLAMVEIRGIVASGGVDGNRAEDRNRNIRFIRMGKMNQNYFFCQSAERHIGGQSIWRKHGLERYLLTRAGA